MTRQWGMRRVSGSEGASSLPGWTARLRACGRRSVWAAALVVGMKCAAAQDLNLSPTRPTISNSATVQSAGVLQVEIGYDGYPPSVPGNQETVATSFFYTPASRLRLDFGWAPFGHQPTGVGEASNGVGDVEIGGKVEVKKEQYHRRLPGMAVQYEAELPTASQSSFQSYGQQAILLMNHHYGRDGNVDVIVNGSVVQTGCQAANGCSYGGQQAAALSYHVQKQTRLYVEAFGQNVSQSNTPPGTYLFGGFYRQVSDGFGIDGGMRFGVSGGSPRVGVTMGLVLGKRLRRGRDGGEADRAEARP